MLRRQSDERLVALARAGHPGAIDVIVARYRAPLLRYCRRLLGPARAEDAVQQTFLKAYRGISDGDSELELQAWLYRIARNVAHDVLRQNGAIAEPIDEVGTASASAADVLAQRERFRTLVAAMRRLPARQRRAIVGRELEGRSHADLASELGVTDGAVRQLIHRARNALRGAASAAIPGAIARWLPVPTPSVKIGATLAATGALVAGGIAPPFAPDRPARLPGASRPLVEHGRSGPPRVQTTPEAGRSAPSPAETTYAATGPRLAGTASRGQVQPGRGSAAVRGSRADRPTPGRPGAEVNQTGEHRGGHSDVSGPPARPSAVAVTASQGGQQHGHSDGAGAGLDSVSG
jgi:RNA polymerase sigma factor (sigma-70 family)